MESLKISIHYHQDKKKELLRTCQSIADQARLEKDCLQSRVEEDNENDKAILFTQEWQNWTGLSNFFSADQFRALLGAMKLFGRSYEIKINDLSLESQDELSGELKR
jgi:quinol monooxygenase YgiN